MEGRPLIMTVSFIGGQVNSVCRLKKTKNVSLIARKTMSSQN